MEEKKFPPLTKLNCHRASSIRKKHDPERYWSFWYQHNKSNGGTYVHSASNGDDICGVSPANFPEWEVTSFKYEWNLEDLYQSAVRSFSMTSFSPEERAMQYIRGYEQDLIEDLKLLSADAHQAYFDKYKAKVADLFAKHSRCASPMITGPAKFPTERNRKANEAYDKAVGEFHEWRSSYIKRAKHIAEASLSQDERDAKEWSAIRKDILSSCSCIKSIDDGTDRGYRRSAFVNSIYGKVETLANNGKMGLVQKAIQLIKEVNEKLPKPVFTSRHKFWQLEERCQNMMQREKERSEKEDVEIPFDGGHIVKNYAVDRIQIFHNEKPEYSVISSLKKSGFRWSPSNGCWQRQLNDNGILATARIMAGADQPWDKQNEWYRKIKEAK